MPLHLSFAFSKKNLLSNYCISNFGIDIYIYIYIFFFYHFYLLTLTFLHFFLWEEFYTFDFKVCLGLLNKLNSCARLSLNPILFLFLFIYSYYLIVYTLKIFLCIFCKSFLIWKKIKNDIKQLSELIIFFLIFP